VIGVVGSDEVEIYLMFERMTFEIVVIVVVIVIVVVVVIEIVIVVSAFVVIVVVENVFVGNVIVVITECVSHSYLPFWTLLWSVLRW